MTKQTLIPTGNKHVMMDESGREYYQRKNGTWAPGYYDERRRAFIWTSTRKYYARTRTFEMPDGTMKSVTLTKYTYQRKTNRPDYAPVGRNGQHYKRAYLETFADLYWDGELLWKAANVAIAFDADGKPTEWMNTIVPFTDWSKIWDRYPDVKRDIVFDEPTAA